MLLIVPYRDRLENLKVFSEKYKGFDVLIVEQTKGKLFNRGKLLNIGFKESEHDLVCFHDVDLIAWDFRPYKQDVKGAVHFSGLCEQFGYKKFYDTLFGGVTAFDRKSFEKCNGFSNNFWGWGGEDDDLYNRTQIAGINVDFKPYKYHSLSHKKQDITPQYELNKAILSNTKELYKTDGLNTLEYKVLEQYKMFGFNRILVDL